MSRKYFGSKPVVFFGIVCLGCLFYLKLNFKFFEETTKNREQTLKDVINFIKTGYKAVAGEGQACKVPYLDMNSPEITLLLKKNIIKKCNDSVDWVEIDGSTAKISDWALKNFKSVECSFRDVIRQNDYQQHLGSATRTHTEYNLETSDAVDVFCENSEKKIWNKTLLGVRSDQDILDRTSWTKVPEDSLKLNVLIFGMDSLSHNMWRRKLSKSYKYATEELEGIALNGYNIVGDGTPQALIPIFTGKTELELPETRRKMGDSATYVNVYPFIWNDYRNSGYVTMFMEEMPLVGTFNYRLKGFNEAPVDHYARPFYLEISPYFDGVCYGGLSKIKIMADYFRGMYKVYKDKPKFMFGLSGEYSHDNLHYTVNVDDELLLFLKQFKENGYLNNTVLILMSDHGTRFSNFRSTQQGKQEERLPGFIFVLPNWFKNKYPEAYGNLKKNADRLSTPFDIHETLKSILHFDGAGKGDKLQRGISLFKEIPLSRTCQDAFIEPHWCTCLDWEKLSNNANIVKMAAIHFVDFINSMTYNFRRFCSKVKLKSIISCVRLIPNSYLLKFKSSDSDGFIGFMTDKTSISSEFYQIQLTLSPGNMHFEVTMQYLLRHNKFVIKTKDISRINRNHDMIQCTEGKDYLIHLQKFCYCH